MASADLYSTDIIICGGGLVGMSLALALAETGLSITVLEREDPQIFDTEAFDGRVSAIAYGSQQMFARWGVWDAMEPYAGPIKDIRITDADSPLFLHYDHRIAGTEPMGYIVENRYIRRALMEGVKNHHSIRMLAPVFYQHAECEDSGVEVALSDGRKIVAKLIACAEGRNSPLRNQRDIRMITHNYGQTAIVCTVHHQKHHQSKAIERFLPAGPFAILPLKDGNLSSLVWTEKSHLAPHFIAMEEPKFLAHLAERFGDHLGKISLHGPRWSYPLSLSFAEHYTDKRFCLIGDAAHGIHPIAGQGFNLGLRDVAALAELIQERSSLGLDIGSVTMLDAYESRRKADNLAMIAITDRLNRLFSNNIAPIAALRRIGLSTVEHMPALKKRFMQHAMGTDAS